MKAKNQDNLKALIKLMKTLPEELLDMENWTCGTAACVGGWVARMPEFHALGGRAGLLVGSPIVGLGKYTLAGEKVLSGPLAVAYFLGVSERCAEDLCLPTDEEFMIGGYSHFETIWRANTKIPFKDVKPSDVVEFLETWLEEEEV